MEPIFCNSTCTRPSLSLAEKFGTYVDNIWAGATCYNFSFRKLLSTNEISDKNESENPIKIQIHKKAVGSPMTRCCGEATITTQARCPSTVLTGRFSLLCFQPEALLDSLAARTSRTTVRYPCGMGTWRGRSINVPSATSRNWFVIHQPRPHLGYRHARPHPSDQHGQNWVTS